MGSISRILACCMYQYTWASIEGVGSILHTKSGSAAGTPLADIVYVAAMSKVMVRLRDVMCSRGLRSYYLLEGVSYPLDEVGYVDDSAFPILSPADKLVDKTINVAVSACEVFCMFGMELNWKPGKSEALPIWSGPMSKKSRRDLVIGKGSTVECVFKRVVFHLRFVSVYKHLWNPY